MNNTSKTLSIIAFYFSEYDMDAVKTLGYSTRREAFKKISEMFKRENNYLKLRRDEFDVITNSHRNGWKNRKPANDVLSMAEYLKTFSFMQITQIVKSIIENAQDIEKDDTISKDIFPGFEIGQERSEEELEQIINFVDSKADVIVHTGTATRRIYQHKIVDELKNLYKYKCQICGYSFVDHYGIDLAEAHHIEPFSKTHNNNASNIIILCPNHHRIIHRLNPFFDRESMSWKYPDGNQEILKLNYHL